MRDGGIPRDPERLQRIVLALLVRIERKNQKEALDLAGYIQCLAGQERRFHLYTPEQRGREKGKRLRLMEEFNELVLNMCSGFETDVLHHIESGKVPRTRHARDTVVLQRDMITKYLECHPFKVRPGHGLIHVRRGEATKKWLSENGPVMWAYLFPLPCYCGYRESFDGLLDDRDALSNCTGGAGLTDLLLAQLHTSITPAAIRKIISHAPPPSL
jgi:hypothetical protein